MKRTELTHHSQRLDKDMRMLVFGEGGYPIIVFPTQDAMCDNFENFGMVDTLSDYIDSKQIQLFCVDSVDAESWSNVYGDRDWRAERQEQYYEYITEEVVPLVAKTSKRNVRPLAMGASMGATQAAIMFLRRPDLFQGIISLSGVYDAQDFFGNWMSSTLYDNSPVHFLPNMPADHPYIDVYNKRQIVLCVGQGAWEEAGIRTQRVLADAFERLGVDAWCDFWGFDVNHDWPWWKRQVRYFLPYVLEEAEEVIAEEAAASMAKPAAKKAATKKPAAKKATAAKPAAKKATATKAAAPKPAAEKATAAKPADKKATATKAAAPKAEAKKAEAKPAATATKAAATKAEAKPVAKKAEAKAAAATKAAAAKPAAEKAEAKPATKAAANKDTTAKPAAKKTPAK